MKRALIVMVAVALALAFGVAPALAASVPTSVTVTSCGHDPIVKAKFETNWDPMGCWEDGDCLHQTMGTQIMPSGEYQVSKPVAVWAVVTDPVGMDDLDNGIIWADVFYPEVVGTCTDWCNAAPIEITLEPVGCGQDAYNTFMTAYNYGLVTLNNGITATDVGEELLQCQAWLFMGIYTISYHDPAGCYTVVVTAQDECGGLGSLENWFQYVSDEGIEIDFDAVNYAPVSVGKWKQVGGDTIFDTDGNPLGTAPSPEPATVRNIGNCDVQIKVVQDDMGFGKKTSPAGVTTWNVHYWARLGNAVNGTQVFYEPNETATIPNILCLCHTEKLDFGIKVDKTPAGSSYIGMMTLSVVGLPFADCTESVE